MVRGRGVRQPPIRAARATATPCYELSACTGEVGAGMVCESVSVTAPTLYECTGYRLPTDAEWEYAVRAGTLTTFYSGDITANESETSCCGDEKLERIAWYCWNSGPTERAPWPELQAHRVGQKEPNTWGLFDMMGNVAEHVNDPYSGRSPSGPVVDPGGDLGETSFGITRGGFANTWSWWSCSAVRRSWFRHTRGTLVGFRLVRTVP